MNPGSLTRADAAALQRTIGNAAVGGLVAPAVPAENRTGLPDRLKIGIENLSGFTMDDVRVHYNSSQPSQLRALAYTQGTSIHVAPGQERHLPHEAWHVVQQKQGRVTPTLQMEGVAINDDDALEREADRMSARAAASTVGGEQPLSRSAPPDPVVAQMVWKKETYALDNKPRTLFVDERSVTWGAAKNIAQAPKRPRAFLFETIAVRDKLAPLIARLNQPATVTDTGLTVVVNTAYTPDRQKKGKLALGNDLDGVVKALDEFWGATTAGWQGLPMQIVTAAWERRIQDAGSDHPYLEPVQGSVPYSTLRRIAATNPGATAIEAALQTKHEYVWRKMGDDDMPFVDPNPEVASGEVAKLESVENQLGMQNTFVTFGYDLVTEGTEFPVTGLLKLIYQIEMQLRDKIRDLGAPIYPSEPTTFYRAAAPGAMDATWHTMEKQQVGGSGQQLEGAKLMRAGGESKWGVKQFAFHTVQVQTAAGRRNDDLIHLLSGWYADGDIAAIDEKKLNVEINKLDQSALRHDEYLKKVVGNLGGKLAQQTHLEIAALVELYRKRAVDAVCQRLRTLMRLQKKWPEVAARYNLDARPVAEILPHHLPMERDFVTNALLDRAEDADEIALLQARQTRLRDEIARRPAQPLIG